MGWGHDQSEGSCGAPEEVGQARAAEEETQEGTQGQVQGEREEGRTGQGHGHHGTDDERSGRP